MISMRQFGFGAFTVGLLVLTALGVAFGSGRSVNVQRTAVPVGYVPETDTGDYRDMFSVADLTTSTDLEGATLLAVPSVGCAGCTKVKVQGLFQGSGATAAVAIVRYRVNNEVCGYQAATLTAVTTKPKVGSLFPSTSVEFATENADHVRIILVTDVSAQGFKLRAGSH